MLVSLSHVSKIYKRGGVEVKALDDVSLEIEKGEFVAIQGPSGSGKSTLMHIMGCLDTPTSGRVVLEGKDVSKLSEAELAKIRNQKVGFVFQNFNLLPRTSSLENVTLPLTYRNFDYKEALKKAKAALEKVGLSHRMEHFSNQLSGGEQQRVAIARALVGNPSIILADEPTGNLDSHAGREIMETFKKLNEEGNTIIIVTHETSIARYAKRIIRLKDGRIE